jgi:subtilisin family serine protease
MKIRLSKLLALSLFICFLFSESVYGVVISNDLAEGPGRSQEKSEKYKRDEVLIKFKPGVSEKDKQNLHKKFNSEKIKEFPSLRLQRVKLKKDLSVEEAIRLYKADPGVEYAEPNFFYKALNTPNDPSFSQLWGMTKINAPAAWDLTTGNSNIVVTIIDTGVDYSHPDLSGNMWVNTAEIAGNGLMTTQTGMWTISTVLTA